MNDNDVPFAQVVQLHAAHDGGYCRVVHDGNTQGANLDMVDDSVAVRERHVTCWQPASGDLSVVVDEFEAVGAKVPDPCHHRHRP